MINITVHWDNTTTSGCSGNHRPTHRVEPGEVTTYALLSTNSLSQVSDLLRRIGRDARLRRLACLSLPGFYAISPTFSGTILKYRMAYMSPSLPQTVVNNVDSELNTSPTSGKFWAPSGPGFE